MTLTHKSDFIKDVFEWLSGAGFDCVLGQNTDTLFNFIEVFKNKNIVLHIDLIDLERWLKNNISAKSELVNVNHAHQMIRSKGISLVTLWEDVWLSKTDVVKSRLSAILGVSQRIPGRVTEVRKIHRPVANEFLDKNHLQGAVSSKIRYGLFLPKRYFRVLSSDYQFDEIIEELLVAVATFSHPRTFDRDGKPFRSFELSRFANLRNTTVVGGFDKLLRAFSEEYKPDDIMTYADLEWSDGASYRRLGFKEILDKEPNSFWIDTETNKRYSDTRKPENGELINIHNAGSRKFVKEIYSLFHL